MGIRVHSDHPLPPDIQTPEAFIEKSLSDLFWFCAFVLRHGKRIQYRDLGPIHMKLCDFLSFKTNPVKQKLVLMHRDALKSTIGRGLMIQEFLGACVRKDEALFGIVCGLIELAGDHLEAIQNEIFGNEYIQAYFRGYVPRKRDECRAWGRESFRWKNLGIDTGSLKKSLSGKHYRGVWNDNLVNEVNYATPDLRKWVVNRWQSQEPLLSEDAWELVSETPWETDDVSGVILDPNGQFDYKKLYRNPGFQFISETGYAVFSCPVRYADGTLVFPQKIDEVYLERKRRKMGSLLYNRMYELQPILSDEYMIKPAWIQHFKDLPDNFIRIIAVDCSGTKGNESTASGVSIVEWDENENAYVDYAEKRQVTPVQLFNWICEEWDRSKEKGREPTYVLIEREKYGIFLMDLIANERPDIRALTIPLHGASRRDRHFTLIAPFENGQVRLREGMKQLEEELKNLRPGKTKDVDLVDTLFLQMQGKMVPRKGLHLTTDEKKEKDELEEFRRQIQGSLTSRHGSIQAFASRYF